MKRTVAFLFAIALVCASQQPGAAPRFDSWKVIGPGGGGTMIMPTVSPHDPKIVVEHCDMTGAYITLDGARSWRIFNLRGGVSTSAYDPKNSKVIYAGNHALWRSEDAGRSWSMVLPDPKKNTVEHQLGDHADYSLTSDDKNYPAGQQVTAIAVDPADSNRIYVAFGGRQQQNSTILVSRDHGASWALAGQSSATVLSVLPEKDGFLAVAANGVLRAGNGGLIGEFPGGRVAKASAGRVNGKLMVYATTGTGALYLFDSSAQRWAELKPQLGQKSGRFEAIAASEQNGNTAYVGFRGLALGDGRENTYNGITKTSDGGRTWAIVHKESARPSENLEPSWIEGRAQGGGRDIWFDTPYSLGAATTTGQMI